jgi:predicted nucleic acid-binding protein
VKVVYAETSVVLGWLLEDRSLPESAEAIDSAEQVVTSTLTLLEANRGIRRAARQRRVTLGGAASLKALLARAAARWDLLEITPEIRMRAGEPFPVEPVRTLDAIHLATARASQKTSQVFPF